MKRTFFGITTFLGASVLGLGVAFLAASCASTPSAGGAKGGPVVKNEVPEGEVILLDDFEEGTQYWNHVGDAWDQWGSHNLSIDSGITDEWGTEGEHSGEWEFDVAGPDTSKQATFTCYSLVETDWTGVKYLVADINNISGQDLTINSAVQNGVDWNWSQTPDVLVPAGVNINVIFDYTVNGITEAQQIACGMIQVMGENEGGTILVDNIRLVK